LYLGFKRLLYIKYRKVKVEASYEKMKYFLQKYSNLFYIKKNIFSKINLLIFFFFFEILINLSIFYIFLYPYIVNKDGKLIFKKKEKIIKK
jgi:hypothetical protein